MPRGRWASARAATEKRHVNVNQSAGTPASGTPFVLGPPSPIPGAIAPDDNGYPTLVGVLCGRLTWFPDEGSDPPTETAQSRIEVVCPTCRRVNTHGRRLDGDGNRVDQFKVPHCNCGGRYHVRPARPGEPGYELHEYPPTAALKRLAGRRGK